MFFDSQAWPPPAGGDDPPRPSEPRLTKPQERVLMRLIAWFLLALFVGPLAGSSVVSAVAAMLS